MEWIESIMESDLLTSLVVRFFLLLVYAFDL